jgi:peptidyl-prolyl cis-trans isomerase SurA
MAAAHFCIAQPQGQVIDRVLGIVGKNIVKQSELESQCQQYISQGISITPDVRCKLFEELLYQKLLIAQAEKDSVTVSDAQVDSEIDRRLRYYITQFGSQEKFESFYGKTTEQFREDLRDDVRNLLLAQTMQQRVVGEVSVSPSEIKSFYAKIPKDSLPYINAEVEIGQIIRKPSISAEAKKEAKEQIEDIRQQIVNGKDFGFMAKIYSEDPGSKNNGGLYQNIQRGQFVPEWDALAFSLKPGELSPVFETVYGYFIIQVVQRKGEFVDARSLLIIPKVTMEDMGKARSLMDSVYTLLQRDSISFSDAAGKYSDDDYTKQSGGLIMDENGSTRIEMSKLSQVDPTIVFTVDKMKVGEMTEPAITQTPDGKQGYRILYLKSRSEPHVLNLKDDYQQVQNMAMSEKQQKLINEWIKRKLENTWVHIADDYKNCKFDNSWSRN